MLSITKEMLEERLKLYQTELQQLPLLAKIYEGAIQDCTFWLTSLEEKDKDSNDSA